MNRANLIVLAATLAALCAPSAWGQIYTWTDAEGVKHFSDRAPETRARDYEKIPEAPYDAQADRQRREQDTRYWERRAEDRRAREARERKAEAPTPPPEPPKVGAPPETERRRDSWAQKQRRRERAQEASGQP